MPKIYDSKTREELTLPHDQLQDSIASGAASFAANDIIPVISPDGDIGTVPAVHIRDAISKGFQIETPEQTAVREYVEKNKGLKGDIKQALHSFVNQAAMDVPDTALAATDPLQAQKNEALRADHQLASVIGGVPGFATSLLYGGGEIAAAGKAAERAVASQLGEYGIKRGVKSIAKDLAARTALNASRLGTEAALFATPKATTELLTGNPELAGETLLANGLFGIGLGTLGGTIGVTASKLKKAFPGTALEGEALQGAKILDDVSRQSTADKFVAKFAEKNPEDIAYTKQNIKRMETTPSLDESAPKNIPNEMQADRDLLRNEILPQYEKQVQSALDAKKITVNTKEIENLIDNINQEMIDNGVAVGEEGQAAIKRMEGYKKRLIPLNKEGLPEYRDMNGRQVRKFIQVLRDDNGAWQREKNPLNIAKLSQAERSNMDLSESISDNLKDKLGNQYKDLMSKYSESLRVQNSLDKQFNVINAFQNRVKKPIQDKYFGGFSKALDPESKNLVKNIQRFGQLMGKDYETMVRDRLTYARMFPEKALTLKGDSQTLTGKISDIASQINLATPLKTAMNIAGAVGFNKESLLHRYVTNGSIVQSTNKIINRLKTIPDKINGLISKKVPVKLETISIGAIGRMLGHDAPKSRKEQLKEMNQKLSEFTQNPSSTTRHLADITKGLSPDIAQSITTKNTVIGQYLQSVIPKPKNVPSPFHPQEWEPSAHELSKFERCVHAIQDPLSVIDDLENGTLTKESIEAIQTVYPQIYEQIQNKVIEALTDQDKPLPYAARIKLSLLMGQSFDDHLTPEVIANYQMNYQKQDQSDPAKQLNVNLPDGQTNIDRVATS